MTMKHNWTYKPLANLCNVFVDGDWIESKDQSNSGIRLIQTGNIGVGVYLDKTERSKFISEETFYSLNCTEIFEGDILISRLPDPIGRACILPKLSSRAITAVDVAIVRPKSEILPRFVLHILNPKITLIVLLLLRKALLVNVFHAKNSVLSNFLYLR